MFEVENKIQENKLQLLGKLTASLIHEIRNPLSAIKLTFDFLKLIENSLPEEATESIDISKEALARIQYLMDNVLTFSRKDSKYQQNCSLNEISKTAVNLIKSSANKKDIKIELELDNSIPNGYFDKNKILQVFINLITNAIESCSQGDTVKIRTRGDDPDYIIWEVIDNGEGISEELKEKIFQDFYTSKEKGTGLGLSVCKMLLQPYQAKLDFTSTLGVGTKFIIMFNPNLMQINDEIQSINS